MQLDRANSNLRHAIHFGARIGNRPRQHAAKCNQAVGRRAAIFRAPVIHLWREPDNFRRNIIDQPRPLDSEAIQVREKRLRIIAVPHHIRIIFPPALHQVHRGRLHHVIRHDVNVDVDDRLHSLLAARASLRTSVYSAPLRYLCSSLSSALFLLSAVSSELSASSVKPYILKIQRLAVDPP